MVISRFGKVDVNAKGENKLSVNIIVQNVKRFKKVQRVRVQKKRNLLKQSISFIKLSCLNEDLSLFFN